MDQDDPYAGLPWLLMGDTIPTSNARVERRGWFERHGDTLYGMRSERTFDESGNQVSYIEQPTGYEIQEESAP